MSNFTHVNEVIKRLADEHKTLRDKAVENVNKIIRAATEFPIKVPKSLFTDIAVVRHELMRKLREESGWEVRDGELDPYGIPNLDERADRSIVYLWNASIRRDEEMRARERK